MRYMGWLIGFLVVVISSGARAADHDARINEVLVSFNGNAGIQFVEIVDASAELFPSDPYRIDVFDANGVALGNPIPFDVASGTTRIYLSTQAADAQFTTVTPDRPMGPDLPAAGQVCFVNSDQVKIHCLAWGCINTVITGTVNTRAPAPPDGQSVQRQPNGTYQLAAPTPNATNTAGTIAANCPTDPPAVDGAPVPPADAGVNPGNDAGNNNNNSSDDGGCCGVSGQGTPGAFLLAFVVLFAIQRRRD